MKFFLPPPLHPPFTQATTAKKHHLPYSYFWPMYTWQKNSYPPLRKKRCPCVAPWPQTWPKSNPYLLAALLVRALLSSGVPTALPVPTPPLGEDAEGVRRPDMAQEHPRPQNYDLKTLRKGQVSLKCTSFCFGFSIFRLLFCCPPKNGWKMRAMAKRKEPRGRTKRATSFKAPPVTRPPRPHSLSVIEIL